MQEQGFTIINNDLFDDKFISGQEKWLLVVLIRYWNSEKGYAYPSYETLMEKADMSKATLRKHLVNLELKNYIEIIKHRGKTVENNTYKINKYLCLEIKLSDSEEKSMFDDSQSLEIKPSQSLKTKLDRVQKLNRTNTIYTNTNKNIKKKKGTSFDNSISNYTNNPQLVQALIDFIKMRKTIKKPMTDRALTMLISKLDNIAVNDEEKVEILNQSIFNSWQGIFPLKRTKFEGSKQSNDDWRNF